MSTKVLARLLLVVALLLPVGSALAQDGEDLSEAYTSSDGRMTFSYPTDWTVEEPFPGMMMVSNDPATFDLIMGDGTGDTIPAGSVLLLLFAPSIMGMFVQGEMPETLEDYLTVYGGQFISSEVGTIGESEAITVGDYEGVMASVSTEKEEGSMIALDIDGNYIMSWTMTPEGEYADRSDLILSILETITYTIPEGLVTFSATDESLSFDYPGAWYAVEVSQGMVVVSNVDVMTNLFSGMALDSGAAQLFIFQPSFIASAVTPTDLPSDIKALATYLVEGEQQTVGEPEEVKFGDYDAARLDYETELTQGYLMGVDFDGSPLYFMVRAAVGELADQEEAIAPILESIQYTPVAEAAATEVATEAAE